MMHSTGHSTLCPIDPHRSLSANKTEVLRTEHDRYYVAELRCLDNFYSWIVLWNVENRSDCVLTEQHPIRVRPVGFCTALEPSNWPVDVYRTKIRIHSTSVLVQSSFFYLNTLPRTDVYKCSTLSIVCISKYMRVHIRICWAGLLSLRTPAVFLPFE